VGIRFVARAEAGEEIVIARSGRPVARLVSFDAPSEARTSGRMRGRIRIADDIDKPLPDDVLADFYAGTIEPR